MARKSIGSPTVKLSRKWIPSSTRNTPWSTAQTRRSFFFSFSSSANRFPFPAIKSSRLSTANHLRAPQRAILINRSARANLPFGLGVLATASFLSGVPPRSEERTRFRGATGDKSIKKEDRRIKGIPWLRGELAAPRHRPPGYTR